MWLVQQSLSTTTQKTLCDAEPFFRLRNRIESKEPPVAGAFLFPIARSTAALQPLAPSNVAPHLTFPPLPPTILIIINYTSPLRYIIHHLPTSWRVSSGPDVASGRHPVTQPINAYLLRVHGSLHGRLEAVESGPAYTVTPSRTA